MPLRAAEVLELQLDGLAIPIDLHQLKTWSQAPERNRSDLAMWLNLLDERSRRNLKQLLEAPLLRDRSFGRQLLSSWTGEQLLNELGQLLRLDDGRSEHNGATLLRQTVNGLLERQNDINSLDLLLALPSQRVSLKLDGVFELAQQWHDQLERQRLAWQRLNQLKLPQRQASPLELNLFSHGDRGLSQALAVSHRREPLPLELWPSRSSKPRAWVLLMPGLGGSGGQLSWLAAALARWGWPVVVVDHPGSDEAAMKASLEGQRPPPGAESLQERLGDVEAVLAAQRRGDLAQLGVPPGTPVVLMGHSLGGLIALMAAGQTPEPALEARCRAALSRLPLTNLSRLLQCQLPGRARRLPQDTPIAAVVAFNSFGSLLWPRQGLARLEAPVLLVGGSLDLITPPLDEQLGVFAGQRHARSRLVLIDGGSHFSPVRVNSEQQAVFRLGDDLVGVDPLKVQALLLQLTHEFLQGLDEPLLLSPQTRTYKGVRAHVLDSPLARRWQQQLRNRGVDRAEPPTRRP